jgi:hypothetical protein
MLHEKPGCPLCVARQHLDERLESKADSNQKTILELFTTRLLTREIAQDFGYLSEQRELR